MIKKIMICLALILSGLTVAAQVHIKGIVIDATTNEKIDFAEVAIQDLDGITLASGLVNKGAFDLRIRENVTCVATVFLVGYKQYTSNKIVCKNESEKDLGTISLVPDENGLDAVTFVEEKDKVVYKLDRTKISGSSSLTAAGGTAANILSSLPAIRVDAEGGISYRGSTNFLVFVDGRPSALEGTQALEQISASIVEDIEIITTPSAKFKTEGDVGIINIITQKSHDQGFSGNVDLTGSTIGTWAANVLLNYRKNASRWYFGTDLSEIRRRSEFSQQKTTIVEDYNTLSDANGIRHGCNSSYIGKLGWEYSKKGHNLLIEGQLGDAETARGGELSYYELRKQGSTVLNENDYNSRDRYSNEKRLVQGLMEYEWKINDKGDKLKASSRMRYDWYALEYTESNMFELDGTRYEGTRGYEGEHHWDADASASYEKHFLSSGVFEAGWQYITYSEHGNYNIKYWDRDVKDFNWDPEIPFYYRRQTHAGYLMLTDAIGNFSYNVGVRAEKVIDKMNIEVKDASRFFDKPIELFPSAHIAYSAPKKNTISAGYSRRINRPGIWKLEPYITYEDYYTKCIGNPDIGSEYINSYEVGYKKGFAQKQGVGLTAYYRTRSGVVDRIRRAYEPGVTLDSLINAGSDKTLGLEFSAAVKATDFWDIRMSADVYRYSFTANYEGCKDSRTTSFGASLMNNFNVLKGTDIQLDANLVGPKSLTQGHERGYFFCDLAVKRSFLKEKISAALVAHDVFHTARYRNFLETASLTSETFVRPVYPNIVLSISYSFNSKPKAANAVKTGSADFEGKEF